MLCGDIIKLLEVLAPPEYALEWDNVGLLVGDRNKEVKKILVAVDATDKVCNYAIHNSVDMIITHHPVIFSKINRINSDTILGKKLLSLIKADISCFAMHTNYDTKGGMAKNAADMLGLKNSTVLEETVNGEGIGRVGLLDKKETVLEVAQSVKKIFDLKNVIIYGDTQQEVDKIAVSPGSGKSVIVTSVKQGAECLITGDIGHHEGIDAVEMGINIIDASHYGIEKIFMNYIYNYLKEYCSEVEIQILDTGVPFEVV